MANPARRDSRVETQRPGRSPFRSQDDGLRADSAVNYVLQREAEIEALSARLANAQSPAHRRALTLRLQATRANLASWIDYLNDDAPRVGSAVMTPRKRVARAA